MTYTVKVAGMILGIIGGVLDALFGILVIIGGVFAGSLIGSNFPGLEQLQGTGVPGSLVTGAFVIMGLLILIVAALAIIGGAMAQKKPVVSGILLLVAGVLNFFGGVPGFIVALLLITGGVLTLVAANQDKTQAAPPAPAA